MSNINDGGPAFPQQKSSDSHGNQGWSSFEVGGGGGGGGVVSRGMSLRDYFAAKAVQGLLASEVEATEDSFAAQAYVMADAMLAARSKP